MTQALWPPGAEHGERLQDFRGSVKVSLLPIGIICDLILFMRLGISEKNFLDKLGKLTSFSKFPALFHPLVLSGFLLS